MIVWVDAQFSPAIAAWLAETFSLEAHALQGKCRGCKTPGRDAARPSRA